MGGDGKLGGRWNKRGMVIGGEGKWEGRRNGRGRGIGGEGNGRRGVPT